MPWRIQTMLTLRRWAAGLTAAVLGLLTFASLAASSSGDDDLSAQTKQLEGYWAGLGKGETDATRALLKLADHPKEAVSFLKTKLKPFKISSGEVKALLLKLGNENEALWKPAFEELEYSDPRLAIDLQTLMDRYTEIPVRRRLVEILSGFPPDTMKDREDFQIRQIGTGFNFSAKNATGVRGSWWAEHRVELINSRGFRGNLKKKWTRAVRAIVLLEHIHTPDAVAILKDMAGGHPEAYPTKVALAALCEKTVPASPTPKAEKATGATGSGEPTNAKARQD
jgi:hypothetical protein